MSIQPHKTSHSGIHAVIDQRLADIRSLVALGWDFNAALENARQSSTLGPQSWGLVHLAARVEAGQLQSLIDYNCNCEANRINAATSVKLGVKFARVDVGPSGRYMVDLSTREIFGIKAYGVVHRGHRFGTLETILEWDWRGYRARRATPAVPA